MQIETIPVHKRQLSAKISERFLQYPADDPNCWKKAAEIIVERRYPRKELAALLSDYNRALGADSATLHNIDRLKDSASYCVVTGQQLGFMGGPLYTFLKIISCLLFARQTGAIPIFWAATEDHDQEEIRRAVVQDTRGNLKEFCLSWPEHAGWMVEDLPFQKAHKIELEAFAKVAAPLAPLSKLCETVTGYAEAMLRILLYAFRGTGLVVLEPKLLRPLSIPVLQREVMQYTLSTTALSATYDALVLEGIQPPVTVKDRSRLFYKDQNNRRVPIHVLGANRFATQSKSWSKESLLQDVEQYPQRFSTNVLLRPVVQSFVLPTAAYVAGPTEWLYHHQLKSLFSSHHVPMPAIVHRIHAVCLPASAARWLAKLPIQPDEPLPSCWEECFCNLQMQLKQWTQIWKTAAQSVPVDAIDPFLRRLQPQMRRHLLARKLQERQLPSNALHTLHNLLLPRGELQERIYNWWMFQGSTQLNLVQELLHRLKWLPEQNIRITLT